jgi:SHS family lactate transporter-like MFS transporter
MVFQGGNMHHDSRQESFPETQQMGVGRYLATRLPSLKPPMAEAPNPLKALRMLNLHQWLFFLVAFLAWTWDSFGFFTVSLTIEELSKEFGKTPSQITWGITLVLSIGSGCTI